MRPVSSATIGWYWTMNPPSSTACRRSVSTCSLVTARARIAGSNSSYHVVRSAFARWSAVAASRRISSGRSYFAVLTAMPTVADVNT